MMIIIIIFCLKLPLLQADLQLNVVQVHPAIELAFPKPPAQMKW